MEVKLEVNEGKFKEIIDNELEAFSKDEIKDLIRECIKQYLTNDDTVKNLFVQKSCSSWGGYVDTKPTELLIDAAKSMDLSPAYKEIQESMIAYMKENYQEMMIKIMTELFVEGISKTNSFSKNLSYAVSDGIIYHLQHNHNN